MNDQLAMRPVTEDDLVVLEQLTQHPEMVGEFDGFGWDDPGRFRRKWTESGLLGADGGVLMVVRGSETVGFVSWHRRQTRQTPSSYCWNIGVSLLPQARGRGYGTEAHRLLARYLFAHTTAHRIEAETETGNIAAQRMLEKGGFTREGVLRGCAWRDGAWRDTVLYSLLRTDPPV